MMKSSTGSRWDSEGEEFTSTNEDNIHTSKKRKLNLVSSFNDSKIDVSSVPGGNPFEKVVNEIDKIDHNSNILHEKDNLSLIEVSENYHRAKDTKGEDNELHLSKNGPCTKANSRQFIYDIAVNGCRSIDNWEWQSRINEGTYGVVHKANNKQTGQVVALKRIKISTEEREREGFSICAFREINILLALRHRNIVRVYEMAIGRDKSLAKLYLMGSSSELEENSERLRQRKLLSSLSHVSPITINSSEALNDLHFYMVMDYYDNDLHNMLNTLKKPLRREVIKNLMLQILEGVHHIHSNWYIHRDLKSSNLLVSSKTGQLAIADFGLARKYSNPVRMTLNVVTREYRSPELLLGATIYDTAVDMWSVGCIFAEFFLLAPLFRGKNDFDQINSIFRIRGNPTLENWPDIDKLHYGTRFVRKTSQNVSSNDISLKEYFLEQNGWILKEYEEDLMLRLLSLDPKTRISAKDAIKHPYFTKETPLPCELVELPRFPSREET